MRAPSRPGGPIGRDQLRSALAVFAGLALPTVGVWVAATIHHDRLERARQAGAALAESAALAGRLEATLDRYAGDTLALAHDPSLLRALDDGDFSDAQQRFAVELVARVEAAQTRYIDVDGQEAIRFDRSAEGGLIEAPALQDKSHRAYFVEAIRMAPSDVYVSPLDLNMEHGRVQVPWVPTIRFAAPVDDTRGVRRGVVVVNFDARSLLYARPAALGHRTVIVDPAGEHDFEVGPSVRVGALSRAMRDRVLGVSAVDDDEVRYTVARVEPPSAAPGHAGLRVVTWHGPIDTLPVQALGFLLGLLAVVSWYWGGARVERRAALERSHRAELELAESERMASLGRMVAGVAHELNTPLGNALVGATSLAAQAEAFAKVSNGGELRRSDLDAFCTGTQDGARIVARNLERAAELVSRFKQVAADRTRDDRRSFDVDDVVAEAVEMIRPRFDSGPVTLRLDAESGVVVDGHPGPVGQVVTNLVENALKHGFGDGRAGTVTVATRRASDGSARITVTDDGAGIDASHLPHVFEPFYTTRLGDGGTGLGLAIVHRLVTRRLGGALTVRSTPGVATELEFTLPTALPAPRKEPQHALAEAEPAHEHGRPEDPGRRPRP